MDYFVVQRWILTYLSELNVPSLLNLGNQKSAVLDSAVAQKRGELDSISNKLDRLVAAVEQEEDPPGTLIKRIRELENEYGIVENELKIAEAELEQSRAQGKSLEIHRANIATLLSKLDDPESSPGAFRKLSEEDEMLRAKLAAAIKSLVKKIKLYSAGTEPGLRAEPDTLVGLLRLNEQPYYAILDFGNFGGRLLLPDGVGANWAITDSEGTRTTGNFTTEKPQKSPKSKKNVR